jgi:hypothetical protein
LGLIIYNKMKGAWAFEFPGKGKPLVAFRLLPEQELIFSCM